MKSRRLFSQKAVKEMGYSDADVARFLGINTSALNRLAVSDELSVKSRAPICKSATPDS